VCSGLRRKKGKKKSKIIKMASEAILGQLLQGTTIILFVKQDNARMVFMASLSVPNSPTLVIQGEV